jgi:hypothetical protein
MSYYTDQIEDGFRVVTGRDTSTAHCKCGASFTWEGFDARLDAWKKEHRLHRARVDGRWTVSTGEWPAQWSTTPPTEPGWYWVRLGGSERTVFEVVRRHDRLMALSPGERGSYDVDEIHWWGPKLVPPPLPEEAHKP